MSAESDVDVDLLSTTFTHNTDLIPPKAYLATAPRIKVALRDTTLIDVFTHYDRIANSKQRLFRRMGMLSLWLAGASLLGIDGELLLAALVPAFHSPEVTASIEICALLSVVIASIAWLAGTRTQWLTARYITETIRQWHFQMFLDGQLMSQSFADPAKFQSERDMRWARLMNRVATAQGEMNSFLQSDSVGLHHPLTPYDDLQTADEAMTAYAELRIDKQLSYFTVSKEKFVARDDISETFARWFLVSALLLAAAQLVLLHYAELEAHAVHTTRIILFSCALACVIFTAVIRVYRSALALPQQRERYETKWVRLVALQSAFDAASTIDGKLETMKEVELTEMEEMREFLKEMRRASYIL